MILSKLIWCAGVEARMSEFDKLPGVKKLRVQGQKAVRYFVTIKAAGLNVLKVGFFGSSADTGRYPMTAPGCKAGWYKLPASPCARAITENDFTFLLYPEYNQDYLIEPHL